MLTGSLLISLAYAFLLFSYTSGWRKLQESRLPAGFIPKCRITVLIPARNEAHNIEACLRSVLEVNYPHSLLEIIVIDDFSTDETVSKVQRLAESLSPSASFFSCIELSKHLPTEAQYTPNKKKGIELAISQAKGEIIVTTDADCLVSKDWLLYFSFAFEQPQIQMIAAPVAFHREKNLLQKFQSLDFSGMMGITGAGMKLGWHYMANGANLAYRKSAFENAGGYLGNEHLASGDDMFLVQKFARNRPGSVIFLKSLAATVLTEAAPDFPAFWQQRLRWGAKNAALKDWPLRLSLLTVFLFCWSIVLNLAIVIYFAATGDWIVHFWILMIQIAVKAIADYYFLAEMCLFFKRKDLMRWFWPSLFLHTAYIAGLGTASLFFKRYEWKSRQAT